MNIEKYLKNVFLFDSFGDEEIRKVALFSMEKNMKEGEMLFSTGDEAGYFFIVASGSVKVFTASSAGSEQTLHEHGNGELVAEAAMFGLETYPADCRATSNSKIISIKSRDFIKLIDENRGIAIKLLKSYSERLREFVSLVNRLSLQNVKGRFADFLIKNSTIRDKKNMYVMKGTKKDLASSLGTIPETLSRTLQFFKKEGIIEEDGKSIITLDLERLKSHIS